jgi:hypothetical protein
MLVQAGGVVSAGDIFSPAEKAQMEKANSIERRIKVYLAASKRIQQALQTAVLKEEFGSVPDELKQWTLLLAKSLEDIEANLKSQKRSRSLISYEIQVRKAIADTQGLKIRAPMDQQDAFDSCLDQAETIRKKFVEILFKQSG